jgi:chromosome segregation ATPase
MQSYIKKLENNCRQFFDKYNEQSQVLKPLNRHVKELKDLVELKNKLNTLQSKKQILSLKVNQFEKRVAKIEDRLEKVLEMVEVLQKDPTNTEIRDRIQTDARRIQIIDVRQLKGDVEESRMS